MSYEGEFDPPPPSGGADYREIGSEAQLGELYGALAKAQAAFAPVHRSKTVTIRTREGAAYTFSYAPLEDLLAATRPALGAVGLSVLTPIVRTDVSGEAAVLVVVAHAAGARIISRFSFAPTGDMKMVAGQITYLRRYGYSAMLNLAADDDAEDDGTAPAPTRKSPPDAPGAPVRPAAPKPASEPTPARARGAEAVVSAVEGAPKPGRANVMILTESDPWWGRWTVLVGEAAAYPQIAIPQITIPISEEDMIAAAFGLKEQIEEARAAAVGTQGDAVWATDEQKAELLTHVEAGRIKEVSWGELTYQGAAEWLDSLR